VDVHLYLRSIMLQSGKQRGLVTRSDIAWVQWRSWDSRQQPIHEFSAARGCRIAFEIAFETLLRQ